MDDYNINYDRIKELVNKYGLLKESGKIKQYNEAQTKKDFIEPLFKALGWDVYNEGLSNDYVSVEESIGKGCNSC